MYLIELVMYTNVDFIGMCAWVSLLTSDSAAIASGHWGMQEEDEA